MSSLLHDRHSVCVVCHGFDFSLEECCNECESWSEDVIHKYLEHKKSLEIRVEVVRLKSLQVVNQT